jgi:hypothetical protein
MTPTNSLSTIVSISRHSFSYLLVHIEKKQLIDFNRRWKRTFQLSQNRFELSLQENCTFNWKYILLNITQLA